MNGKRAPRTWAGLTRLRPLRPVRDEADFEKAKEIVGALVGWDDLNSDEADYLSTLAMLMEDYEKGLDPLFAPKMTPLERLKFLMEQHGMNASDLGRLLGSRTHGAALVRGDRQLSKANILRLAEHFGVNPGFFLEGPAKRSRARRKAGQVSLAAAPIK